MILGVLLFFCMLLVMSKEFILVLWLFGCFELIEWIGMGGMVEVFCV